MIHLYTWKTPNGRKVPIALEELHRDYQVHAVDLGADEQMEPEFLELSPNNKIPAIVDERADGRRVVMFESGAILQYLAEDGGELLGDGPEERLQVQSWLHWQIGGLGPMLGQLGHFALHAKEKQPYAIERFRTEVERLLSVMERRLESSSYFGGSSFSIADIAAYPWIHGARTMLAPVLDRGVEGRAALLDWCERVGARPSVRTGMRVLETDA